MTMAGVKVVATLKILKLLFCTNTIVSTSNHHLYLKDAFGGDEWIYSQRLPTMLILPNPARLVENVQLRVLGGEHVVYACAQLRGFVRSTTGRAFGRFG